MELRYEGVRDSIDTLGGPQDVKSSFEGSSTKTVCLMAGWVSRRRRRNYNYGRLVYFHYH